MLRFGPAEGAPVVVVAPPLFEEANRTRALIVGVLRALAAHGIAGVLPELPGQGESVIATVDARLEHWREAFAAATRQVGGRTYAFAIRSGALVDGEAHVAARLHLSPTTGRQLVRDLLRARRAEALASGEPPPADDPDQPGPPLLLAGNLLDRSLIGALMAAEPSRADEVLAIFPDAVSAGRLLAPPDDSQHDGRPRYRKPWTAIEPTAEPGLIADTAAAVHAWMRACDG